MMKIYKHIKKYIYIHDVNIDASQADRALTGPRASQKIYHQLVGYLWYHIHSLDFTMILLMFSLFAWTLKAFLIILSVRTVLMEKILMIMISENVKQ